MSIDLTDAAVTLIWVAALWRFLITVLDRPQTLYRWAFTAGVAGVAVGSLGFAYPQGIADLTGVHMLGTLIAHLGIAAAAGAVAVYVLTLYADTPPQRSLIVIATLTIVVCLIQVITWSAAPIHSRFHTDLASEDGTAPYEVTHYAPLGLYGLWLAQATARLVRRSARTRDRSRTVGLILVSLASFTGATGMLAYLARVGRGQTTQFLDTVGDSLIIFTAATIAIATVIFLVGPGIERRWEDRSLQRVLTPLWLELTTAFPEVRLPGHRLDVDRQIIETHDALSLLQVPMGTHPGEPLRAIAHAVLQEPKASHGGPASDLLPKTQTHAEDTDVLASLAHVLREERQCTLNAFAGSRPN